MIFEFAFEFAPKTCRRSDFGPLECARVKQRNFKFPYFKPFFVPLHEGGRVVDFLYPPFFCTVSHVTCTSCSIKNRAIATRQPICAGFTSLYERQFRPGIVTAGVLSLVRV